MIPPLLLSLRIASAATLLAALVSVPLASAMARRRFPGQSAAEAAILAPLVLPPTVVGYFLIMLLGANGLLGQFLHRATGYSIMFRFEGAVLAAAVVAMPMLYLPAKAAFAAVEPELEDVARLFGAGRLQVFWHVSLPLARRGIFAGIVLAFARALGEFGATLMVYGWLPRRVTLPISFYAAYEDGDLSRATPAVLALTLLALLLVMTYNRVLRPEHHA